MLVLCDYNIVFFLYELSDVTQTPMIREKTKKKQFKTKNRYPHSQNDVSKSTQRFIGYQCIEKYRLASLSLFSISGTTFSTAVF